MLRTAKNPIMARFSFSGHETFTCKSLWLKKGFDFLETDHLFTDDDAVVTLGVGKNMVSSIRFWMRAFGLTKTDKLTRLAQYIFDNNGADPYAEDINTLWLLHYHLVKEQVASLYNLTFLELQRENKMFDREQVNAFVKRRCSVPEQRNVYNENTVRKDIGVMLSNYVMPTSKKSLEEYNALLLDLGLIRMIDKKYVFNQTNPEQIAPEVMLYAMLDYCEEEKTISYDKLQEIALIFCLTMPDLIGMLQRLAATHRENMIYTDNAGVKNVQWLGETMDKWVILDKYYKKK